MSAGIAVGTAALSNVRGSSASIEARAQGFRPGWGAAWDIDFELASVRTLPPDGARRWNAGYHCTPQSEFHYSS
jgi:hypothetical protein